MDNQYNTEYWLWVEYVLKGEIEAEYNHYVDELCNDKQEDITLSLEE